MNCGTAAGVMIAILYLQAIDWREGITHACMSIWTMAIDINI